MKRRPSRRTSALVSTLTGVALLCAAGPSAGAGQAAQDETARTGAGVLLHLDGAGATRPWSSARMRGASPMAAPAPPVGLRTSAVRPPAEPLRTTVRPSTVAAPSADLTAGKLFFSSDGGDKSCSASALNGRSRSLVLTAAHCVHTGGPEGQESTDLVFVPGYDDGRRPKGSFTVIGGGILRGWLEHGVGYDGYAEDVAVLAVRTNPAGKRLGEVVNTNGLQVGGQGAFSARLFGYPGNIDRGETQQVCTKRTSTLERGDHTFRTLDGCGFGPGASGGAWVADYDAGTGVGFARGLVSFGNLKKDYLGSPYLGADAERLRKRVDDAARG